MENKGEKQSTERNRELWREAEMPEMVLRNRDVDEWMEWAGREWNVMEGLERCQSDVGALEMDLAKFYVTGMVLEIQNPCIPSA